MRAAVRALIRGQAPYRHRQQRHRGMTDMARMTVAAIMWSSCPQGAVSVRPPVSVLLRPVRGGPADAETLPRSVGFAPNPMVTGREVHGVSVVGSG